MEITILDGGMGRELQRAGAPFRQPEWSALALIEAPGQVGDVHERFAEAGAQILTTNSYALVPFHIGEARFAESGRQLADRAGRVARAIADRHGIKVAGSLPPSMGSYQPDLFDASAARAVWEKLIAGLSPHVDLWLAETLSLTAEAQLAAEMLAEDHRPLWLSFTLDDALDASGHARLRSGETVEGATRLAQSVGANGLLFNCSYPEVMEAAVAEAALTLGSSKICIGAYANGFGPPPEGYSANQTLRDIRADLDPDRYLLWAGKWVSAGATVIGGCCGTGPEHIAVLARELNRGR